MHYFISLFLNGKTVTNSHFKCEERETLKKKDFSSGHLKEFMLKSTCNLLFYYATKYSAMEISVKGYHILKVVKFHTNSSSLFLVYLPLPVDVSRHWWQVENLASDLIVGFCLALLGMIFFLL